MKVLRINSQLIMTLLGRISLRTLFIVPYMGIILLSVSTVSYLSYQTGQTAVNKLLIKLISSTTQQITDRLTTYLEIPHKLVAMNRYGIEQGHINPDNREELRLHFFQQLKLYQLPTNIDFGRSNGTYTFVAQDRFGLLAPPNSWLGGGVDPSQIGKLNFYILNEEGKLGKNIPQYTTLYKPVQRPWYKIAQAQGQQTWSPVYSYYHIDTASISAVAPVYRHGEFIGVVGCDLVLDDISLFLQNLDFSPSGESFIIERSGDVIATSTEERPFVKTIDGVELVRLKAVNSSNHIIASTAKELHKRWTNFKLIENHTFQFIAENNQRYFAHVYPYQDKYGLDWLIISVLPESEFITDIEANIYRSLSLGMITLFLSMSLALILYSWVMKPILDLSQLAKQLLVQQKSSAFSQSNGMLSPQNDLVPARSLFQLTEEIQRDMIELRQLQIDSEDKFRKIFLTSPDAICIYDINERKIVDVNPIFLELSGYSSSEIIGHDYRDLPLVANEHQLHLIEEKIESLGYIRNLQLYGVTKYGEIKTLLVCCELTVLNRKNYVITFIKDITDRAKSETALLETEARFRSAFEDAGIGMAIINTQGKYIRVNQSLCDLLGYSESELLTKTFVDITHPEDLHKCVNSVQKCLTGEINKFQEEKRHLDKQGNIIWSLSSVSLVRNKDQEPLHFIAQIQDISERHEIEQIKYEFISVVSHEVRTPLTSIKGALGILATGVLDNEPLQKQQMLQIAVNNSDRLLDLVNDILSLEALTSGKMKINFQWCNLKNLAKQTLEDLQPVAANAGITFKSSIPDIQIFADCRSMIQTLTNLLGNAIKFSRYGGIVELSVSVSEQEFLFAVTDQGKGIPPEQLEAIFGRFQQVDVSDARQKGGTGLGLAICKSIVEHHQGRIWAESVLGSGSTFYFTIPRRNP